MVCKYPGQLGHLYSVGGWRRTIKIPYGLDNGAYSSFLRGQPFDCAAYRDLLAKAASADMAPLWVLVPDVVGDRAATLESWATWVDEVASYGWPLAFAAQDGMTDSDVPPRADVVFVGGSTAWKRAGIYRWCRSHPRVHIGRINSARWLWEAHDAGAESCDGTGWFRGDQRQLAELMAYLNRQRPVFNWSDDQ